MNFQELWIKPLKGQALNTAYYIHNMWRQASNYKFPSTAEKIVGKLLRELLLGEHTCTSTPKAAVLTSAKP